MKHPCTNQKDIRKMFWEDHREFTRIPGYTQNDYHTDLRVSFVDYVDYLCRNGVISDKLAQRATL